MGLNPHLGLRVIWNGETKVEIDVSDPNGLKCSRIMADVYTGMMDCRLGQLHGRAH